MSAPVPTWRQLLFGRRARIVWTICAGVSIQAFGWFLVATIMPSVVLDLGNPQQLSWSTTAFLALSIPGSASAGYLKARFGGKPLLIAASVLVVATNVLAVIAPDMTVFLVSRGLQGLGEGMVLSLCYIMVGEALDPEEVAPTFGLVALVWALATLVGPSLAGALTALVSWRVAFVPLIALAVIFLVLVSTSAPTSTAIDKRRLPLGRLGLIAIAMSCLALAANGTAIVWACGLAVTLGLLVVVVRIDRSSVARLFPDQLLSLRRPTSLGIWIIGMMFAAEAAVAIYSVYFVQIGHATSVWSAGQLAALTSLTWSIVALAASRIDKQRARRMLFIGPLVMTSALVLLAFWSSLPLWIGAIGLCGVGAGIGASYGFLTQHIISLAPEAERDVTAGAIPTVEHVAGAIGAAVAGMSGNAAGFARDGAADIPALVPIVVYGSAAVLTAGAAACAVRLYRSVSTAGDTALPELDR